MLPDCLDVLCLVCRQSFTLSVRVHTSTSMQQIVEGRGGEISTELVDRKLPFIPFKLSRQLLAWVLKFLH